MSEAPATESNPEPSRARFPYKFTNEMRASLIATAKTGAPKALIAKACGLSHDTLNEWLGRDDLDGFPEEFEAARAGKALDWHKSIDEAGKDVEGEFTEDGQVKRFPRKGDWNAAKYLLQVTNPEYRIAGVASQLGLKHVEDGDQFSEKQIHHRVIQMIAFPTDEMQGLLRQALARGNPVLQAIVEEHVDERRRMQLEQSSVETTGEEFAVRELPEAEEEFVEEHDPAVRRAPMTPELEYRLSEFRRVLKKHDRVALGGIPISGKGLFLLECTDRHIVHTDSYKDKDWNMVPALANAECANHNRYLLVGVRATGCIREGLNAEVLVWLGEPMEPPLPESLRAMAKGRETALKNLMELRPDLKVVRI